MEETGIEGRAVGHCEELDGWGARSEGYLVPFLMKGCMEV